MSTPLHPIDLNRLMLAFNRMYGMPSPAEPTLNALGCTPMTRLDDFKVVLTKELNEGADIREKVHGLWLGGDGSMGQDMDVLVDLADWLGDIIVYCASEAIKYGIPIAEVLEIIMDSNASKLQADGNAKFDEHGHLEKGPNYWKPEPKIRELLMKRLVDVSASAGPLEPSA